MQQQKISKRFTVCCLLFLTSCVAEKDFDNSSFDAVEPDSSNESSDGDSENVNVPGAYKAKFVTTKGDFVIQVNPEWAPRGAAQFKEAIQDGVYEGARFFRVLEGFMAQFGIAGDPKKSAKWRQKMIPDDPVKQSNKRGMVTYAMAGPGTRTTQIFINFSDNSGSLDPQGFSPFGKVIEGMDVVDSLYAEYGEGAPQGKGPEQGRIQSEGNAYLSKEFPKLDYIKSVSIIEEEEEPPQSDGETEKADNSAEEAEVPTDEKTE